MKANTLLVIFLTLVLYSFSAISADNQNFPIPEEEFLTVTNVSCEFSVLDSDYHVEIGSKIGKLTFLLDTKLNFNKGKPVQLVYDYLNEVWNYSSRNSDSFKDGFPCSDVTDLLKIMFK